MTTDTNKITWIASFPRSGNTWIRALITAYNNGGEIHINNIMQTGDKNPEYYDDIINRPINDWAMSDQALIKPAAMMRMLEDADGNLMLKTHDCNIDLSGVAQIPHDITRAAIYIVRDPRDLALSFKNHYNSASINDAIDTLLDNKSLMRFPNKGLYTPQLSWAIHVSSWMRELPYPVYALRYEDLLTKPFDILSEIIKFLGLDYDAELVTKSIESCQFDKLRKQEEKEGFREGVGQEFFHKGESQRWKQELAPKLQDRIISACRKEMQSLGYL
ncbi:MAG: sulfotransferase domain-containing protein [Cocleimonas sp.]